MTPLDLVFFLINVFIAGCIVGTCVYLYLACRAEEKYIDPGEWDAP